MTEFGTWDCPKNILVILAHPDDPEFFCGATLARWAREGHTINYLILTGGEKGGSSEYAAEELREIRHAEQQAAATIIGAHAVSFLDLPDGMLVADIPLRRIVVREIRKHSPNVIVTCDPTLLFTTANTINHPDHRAAGQVVLDGLFPAAGNSHFFPELAAEGFSPHTPDEVWIALAQQPTTMLNVTKYWEIKLSALKEHRSQIGDVQLFEKRMRSRHTPDSTDDSPVYEERFRVLVLKK